MYIAKTLIALSVALWAAFLGVLALGIIKFSDPRLAPLSMALASILEVFIIFYITMMAAAAADDPRRRRK